MRNKATKRFAGSYFDYQAERCDPKAKPAKVVGAPRVEIADPELEESKSMQVEESTASDTFIGRCIKAWRERE